MLSSRSVHDAYIMLVKHVCSVISIITCVSEKIYGSCAIGVCST
jgi:hypothetical protein